MKYKVGIIGCGAILPRHIEAIESNPNFTLVALCDIQPSLAKSLGKRYKVPHYTDYQKMIQEEDINFIPILTPNSLHKEQSIYALKNKCDVLIEKPVAFVAKDVKLIQKIASENSQKAYCVLQVRLNQTVNLTKKILSKNLLGEIRGFSFTQRWQRPLEYFSGWRGEPEVGGGILYETGIHYLDVLQHLLGVPKITSSKVYTTKHKKGIIEDTVYALADYGGFGGTIESTIAIEPKNLESSICLMGSNGYLKIGGKALNIIESANFLSNGATQQYEMMVKDFTISQPNSYGSYQGSCPNHPEVYKNLNKFQIMESYNVINIIENIYKLSDGPSYF
tara:strand:- start:4425 stop:5429 length:1005 start_codon:yes stop_codon:yes gene_type:complete